MKKTLALAILTIVPLTAFTQATVVDLNASWGLVKQWTSIWDPVPITVPRSGGMVEFFAAPEGTPLMHPLGTVGPSGFTPNYGFLDDFLAANPGWVSIQTTPILAIAAGMFNGGTVTLNNVEPGLNADYFFVGWTGSLGNFDEAFMAAINDPATSFIGVSDVATTATGDPTTIPPGLPGFPRDSFMGMVLAPVAIPEPTQGALAALGVAFLAFVRRRAGQAFVAW